VIREALTREKLNALEPRDAAAQFIARRAEGLTSGEEQLLAEWLANAEAHRQVFASADRAWQSFAQAEGDEILAAMRAHARAARRQSRPAWRPLAAVAAVAILTVATLFLVRTPTPPASESSPQPIAAVTTIDYSSLRGEIKTLDLPDGSRMTLDADSEAVGRFAEDGRNVLLRRGRAYFEIMPDPTRPFGVTAAGRTVFAVGTRFDVNLTTDGVTVTLLEGHVEVDFSDPARPRMPLDPGQQYIEHAGNATLRTVGPEAENATSWRTGLISFDDQSLAEAAAVMNRYSREQIVITDPEVASLRVSGQFRAGDAQRFATTIADSHRLRRVSRNDQIELDRQK
jgi:transmembrane sensor